MEGEGKKNVRNWCENQQMKMSVSLLGWEWAIKHEWGGWGRRRGECFSTASEPRYLYVRLQPTHSKGGFVARNAFHIETTAGF
jgi:hypothetical protein